MALLKGENKFHLVTEYPDFGKSILLINNITGYWGQEVIVQKN